MDGLEIKGLDEFQKKIQTVERRAPDRILKELDKQGNYLRRKARPNTPKGRTGNLRKGYRLTQTEKVGKGYEKGFFNKAPHHHLVNNGHRKVSRSGKLLGWTPGVFYIEKTIAEEKPVIMSDLQGWLDELYKELK